MKKIVKITISALLLSMTVWSVTACQQSIQSEGDNTGTTVSETDRATEKTTANAPDTESTGTEPQKNEPKDLSYNADKHKELCTSEIKAGGETYEIKAFLYDRIGETAKGIRGDAAFGLYKDGNLINTIAPIIRYFGQVGKEYDKDKLDSYFKVIKLDSGEVYAITYPEDNGLITVIFLTVKDGKLDTMERYYSDEERKQLEKDDPHDHPETEKYCFTLPDKFKANGNSIVFESDKEISAEGGSTYAAGEIPLTLDFKNYTVKCEKEEYAGLVYFK